jgi:SAM-dependent methyltransferase
MRRLTLPDSAAPIAGERRNAPSAERNIAPISNVLARVLPSNGRALEIASGTGQHIAEFAGLFPSLAWQPSDVNPENLPSIAAWVGTQEAVLPAIVLNACAPGWSSTHSGWNAICLTNLLHLISTPEASILLREVGVALADGGVFCLYGPFKQGGKLVSEGDERFDASLRAQDPDIGYKDIDWVTRQLVDAGLVVVEHVAMPADNLMLIARRMPVD